MTAATGYTISATAERLGALVALDLLAAFAYLSIPLALLFFMLRRPDVRVRPPLVVFIASIIMVGVTHLGEVWSLWHPGYELLLAIKAVTALAAGGAALTLWSQLPRAIKLPSTAQLQDTIDKLHESEQQFRAFFDNALTVVFIKAADGRMLYANSTYEKVAKVAPGGWRNKLPGELWPAELAEQVRRVDAEVLQGGHPRVGEEVYPAGQGSASWLVYRFPFFSGGQKLLGGIGIHIEEQKAAEAKLRQQKEQLQVTLQSIGDGVVTTDRDGRVTYLNPAAERMTGRTSAGVMGLPVGTVLDLQAGEARLDVDGAVRELLEHGAGNLLDQADSLHAGDVGAFAIELTAAPIQVEGAGVAGAVLVLHDMTEARHLAAELSYQATHDPLTDLLNRREFERRLEHAISEPVEGVQESTLLYLDLDQFKVVNDTCGHAAGDELLRSIADIIGARLRRSDDFARLGGDEFGILLKACPGERAREIAEHIRQAVSDYRFVWNDRMFAISASIGMVTFLPGQVTRGELMSMTDTACYTAKDKGRNCVQVYRPGDTDLAQRHGEMNWVARIQRALDTSQFVLFGQSIVPIQNPSWPSHYEVLLRMRDGDKLIGPMGFIPAAERYGLMRALDRWVIQNALSEIALHADLASGSCFGINLSGSSMDDEGLVEFIREQFHRTGLPPSLVCFEITETIAISNLREAVRMIHELKNLGCKFALDDFGSGMSSFAYLRQLPVDFVKIDGNFVRDIATDPVNRAMVESINKVGQVMGIGIIAEYVEDAETMDILRSLGVAYGQGYGISKPDRLFSQRQLAAEAQLVH